VWFTYISDPVGLRHLDMTGVERLMWSGDYPHGASTWPHSREVVSREHASVGLDDLRKLTFANCAELYGIAGALTGRR
jgi:predicted TIM-barrel fold metal-dependent hydrolase